MYECNAWDFPGFLSRNRFRRNWLERLEFLNRALSRHRLIFGGGQRGLEDVQTPEQLYHAFSERKKPAFWGEKAPVYCTRLRKLFRRYPDGSFIVIWRDPLEIFRSIMRAGQDTHYFRRAGTLSRFIFNQEQMFRQAAEVRRRGGRVYGVSYDDLIDRTRETCQGLCRFLEIEFDEGMLDLANADYSAVFPISARHHEHLRRGVIQRQQFSREILPASVARRLSRFRARWNRLYREETCGTAGKNGEAEPSRFECFYYHMTGLCLHALDGGRRVLLEFLPLPWLSTYRLVKADILSRRAEKQTSLFDLLSAHSITILTSYAILAGVITLDFVSGPDVTMAPFYVIPIATLTLIVGRRWGIFAAALAAIFWSAIQSIELRGSLELGIVIWNSAMRFLVFLTVIFLLDRVRGGAKVTNQVDI